ncbi:MAG: UpxY family transcription antiterminator, partial [Bacteroidota bacterium]
AVYTKSRFEKKLSKALQKAGYEVFLPLIIEKRIWSDRIKKVQVPLFPSYLFLKIDKSSLSDIYYYNGVVKFITIGGEPCIIKEKEIDFIKSIVDNQLPVENTSCCQVGDLVRILSGPLQGWKGNVISRLDNSKILFNLEGIQQTICVTVNDSDIEIICDSLTSSI